MLLSISMKNMKCRVKDLVFKTVVIFKLLARLSFIAMSFLSQAMCMQEMPIDEVKLVKIFELKHHLQI